MITTPPDPDTTQERQVALRLMKRRATGLLAAVTTVFVALVVADPSGEWAPYALAAVEGGMVGGLADWFAVTALFRHPLGLPIPHTAIIRERKDQFGAALGGFVQDNFLSPAIVGERVHEARIADRAAGWLADPTNADTVARMVLESVAGALDIVEDDVVQRLLHEELERMVASVDVAPLAGRLLKVATDDGRHRELLDVGIRGVITFLDDHRDELRGRFGQESPWWLPGALEDRLFDRIVDGGLALLTSILEDPNHEIRSAIDERIVALASRLQTDSALAARGAELKREVLEHAALRKWSASLWSDFKVMVREQAPDAESSLRIRVAKAVSGAGRRLQTDAELRGKLDGWAESAGRFVVENYRNEIGALITTTVSRWDGEETSDKLELLLGRDLQFIRINGTIVGALAGVSIHGLTELLR